MRCSARVDNLRNRFILPCQANPAGGLLAGKRPNHDLSDPLEPTRASTFSPWAFSPSGAAFRMPLEYQSAIPDHGTNPAEDQAGRVWLVGLHAHSAELRRRFPNGG